MHGLSALVSSVWTQHIPPGGPPYLHREIPNGSVSLTCQIGAAPRIIGPRTRPRTEVLAPNVTVVGLRLYSAAAAAVLRMSPAELIDTELDAGLVLGKGAAAGFRADSARHALASLQRLIANQTADVPDPFVAAVVRRLASGSADDVKMLTSSLNTSERHLRRLCRSAVGLAPKELHRILRFQRFLAFAQYALSLRRDPAATALVSLAASAGYADQAHLTRECVRLAGVTPRVFLQQTAEQCGPRHDHRYQFTVHLAGLFKESGRPRR
jgi:AraC-like DNA-binding protein